LDQPYSIAWGKELGYYLAQHTTHATWLVDPATNSIPVNTAERMTLVVTSGWKASGMETNRP
jgi:hypothetical protein